MTKAEETRRAKAAALRYKKPIVKDINIYKIQEELWDISGECDNVRYYFDTDDDTLLNALDGDEDQEYEFKMMFADLCTECEQMLKDLQDTYIPECFNDIFVASGAGEFGGGYLGYDTYEQDYFGIEIGCGLEEQESTKRLMRLTKEQLIQCTQKSLKILYAYLGIRHRYDCLKAALDILRDENTGYLQLVKKIDDAYEKANNDRFYSWKSSTREFEDLLSHMPEAVWLQ